MDNSGPRKARARGTSLISVIGNLGADPEMRFTQAGVAFTSFSVAVNNTRRGPDGEDVEQTDWFRCTAWRGLAEIANNYLQKGSQVFVHGRFRTREWQNRTGEDQTSLEINVNELQLLGRGREEPSGATQETQESDGGVDPDDLPF
jgi:single-strand DNA-binding protein